MAKKKEKKYKTTLKPPTGLQITRNGKKFVCKWSKGDSKYTDQNFKYKANSVFGTGWATLPDSKVGKNTTSKTITFNTATFVIMDKATFAVQGEEQDADTNKKLIKSSWKSQTYNILAPRNPKLSCTLDSTIQYKATFSFQGVYGSGHDWKSDPHMVQNFQYFTIRLKNSNVKDGSKINWSGATETLIDENGTTRSATYTENITIGYGDSYTRYFKVRAHGPNGYSDWTYAHHVYAKPNNPKIVETKATRLSSGSGYNVHVGWTVDSSYMKPVDYLDIQYAIATPDSTHTTTGGKEVTYLTPPNIEDSSWTTAKSASKSQTKTDFNIGRNLNNDECIFVRVVAWHDKEKGESSASFVERGYGPLAQPTASVSYVSSDYLANISVTQDSAISAAFTGIYYRTNIETTPKLVGIWPAGQSDEIQVQLPNPGSATSYSIGVCSYVSDYSPSEPYASGVTNYSLSNIKMQSSSTTWDNSEVPKPPSKIDLTSPREGVVRVSWDWSWKTATGVEISWADHNDAWESTDEPQTYVLSPTRASAWNVAGLDVGEWYFRVRLFATEGESVVYGTYSAIKSIKLAASPNTPVLTVTPGYVSPGGSVSCYWVYSSNEEDEQIGADICEATISNQGVVTYGRILATTNDEQFATVTVPSTWVAGSPYYLAVRVKSSSGEDSENWSNPKPVQVLDPLVAVINSTSLVSKSMVVDGETGETASYLSLTHMPLSISASGPDASGKITYVISRNGSYPMARPDENDMVGFDGETVIIVEKNAETTYSLTTDTTVVTGTTYYTRSGTGTKSDPYTYSVVTPSTGANPQALGYYVQSGFTFDVEIDNEDLLEKFDNRGSYNLIVTATDSYGQVSEKVYLPFIVNWDHRAVRPIADISVDNEEMVAFITPVAPECYYLTTDTDIVEGKTYYTFSSVATPVVEEIETYFELTGVNNDYILTDDEEIDPEKTYFTKETILEPSSSALSTYYIKPYPTDTCDIYRLSTDKPELIIENADFGVKYVDPYPTLGSMGGHRIVYKTADGDYMTDKNALAWTDYGENDDDIVDVFATIIDFGANKAILPYDLSLSTKWSKDFIETKYLGGAVQGDWNPAVSRTSSIKTRVAVQEDSDIIETMRRLAVYSGICHVRTPDGSSYSANVEVSEDREEKKINMIASFSLEVTRIDSEGFDGMTYESWQNLTQ